MSRPVDRTASPRKLCDTIVSRTSRAAEAAPKAIVPKPGVR
jgi:hypothetical protein